MPNRRTALTVEEHPRHHPCRVATVRAGKMPVEQLHVLEGLAAAGAVTNIAPGPGAVAPTTHAHAGPPMSCASFGWGAGVRLAAWQLCAASAATSASTGTLPSQSATDLSQELHQRPRSAWPSLRQMPFATMSGPLTARSPQGRTRWARIATSRECDRRARSPPPCPRTRRRPLPSHAGQRQQQRAAGRVMPPERPWRGRASRAGQFASALPAHRQSQGKGGASRPTRSHRQPGSSGRSPARRSIRSTHHRTRSVDG